MRILFCNYQQIKFESIIVKLACNVLLVVRAGGVGSVQTVIIIIIIIIIIIFLVVRAGGVGSVQAVHSVHSLPLHPPGEGLVDAQGVARGVPVLHLNLRTGVQNRLSELIMS